MILSCSLFCTGLSVFTTLLILYSTFHVWSFKHFFFFSIFVNTNFILSPVDSKHAKLMVDNGDHCFFEASSSNKCPLLLSVCHQSNTELENSASGNIELAGFPNQGCLTLSWLTSCELLARALRWLCNLCDDFRDGITFSHSDHRGMTNPVAEIP